MPETPRDQSPSGKADRTQGSQDGGAGQADSGSGFNRAASSSRDTPGVTWGGRDKGIVPVRDDSSDSSVAKKPDEKRSTDSADQKDAKGEKSTDPQIKTVDKGDFNIDQAREKEIASQAAKRVADSFNRRSTEETKSSQQARPKRKEAERDPLAEAESASKAKQDAALDDLARKMERLGDSTPQIDGEKIISDAVKAAKDEVGVKVSDVGSAFNATSTDRARSSSRARPQHADAPASADKEQAKKDDSTVGPTDAGKPAAPAQPRLDPERGVHSHRTGFGALMVDLRYTKLGPARITKDTAIAVLADNTLIIVDGKRQPLGAFEGVLSNLPKGHAYVFDSERMLMVQVDTGIPYTVGRFGGQLTGEANLGRYGVSFPDILKGDRAAKAVAGRPVILWIPPEGGRFEAAQSRVYKVGVALMQARHYLQPALRAQYDKMLTAEGVGMLALGLISKSAGYLFGSKAAMELGDAARIAANATTSAQIEYSARLFAQQLVGLGVSKVVNKLGAAAKGGIARAITSRQIRSGEYIDPAGVPKFVDASRGGATSQKPQRYAPGEVKSGATNKPARAPETSETRPAAVGSDRTVNPLGKTQPAAAGGKDQAVDPLGRTHPAHGSDRTVDPLGRTHPAQPGEVGKTQPPAIGKDLNVDPLAKTKPAIGTDRTADPLGKTQPAAAGGKDQAVDPLGRTHPAHGSDRTVDPLGRTHPAQPGEVGKTQPPAIGKDLNVDPLGKTQPGTPGKGDTLPGIGPKPRSPGQPAGRGEPQEQLQAGRPPTTARTGDAAVRPQWSESVNRWLGRSQKEIAANEQILRKAGLSERDVAELVTTVRNAAKSQGLSDDAVVSHFRAVAELYRQIEFRHGDRMGVAREWHQTEPWEGPLSMLTMFERNVRFKRTWNRVPERLKGTDPQLFREVVSNTDKSGSRYVQRKLKLMEQEGMKLIKATSQDHT